MLVEVVALEPPHYDEGVVTIHCKKLLTGEAGEVNSVDAALGGGFTQDKTCHCAECEKFFHGSVPCFAARLRWSRRRSFDHLVGTSEQRRPHFETERPSRL